MMGHLPPTDPAIEALLAELPDDPYDVAQVLRAEGIKGKRADAEQCPLAAWLRHRGAWCDAVGAFYVHRRGTETLLPKNVRLFVTTFDTGGYPYLRRTQ